MQNGCRFILREAITKRSAVFYRNAETPNPGVASWFYFRSGDHIEGSCKWYLSGHVQLPVYAVKDGKITGADVYEEVISVNNVVHVKTSCVLEVPKTVSNGNSENIHVNYWDILLEKSIYDDSRVAKGDFVFGEGHPVQAGDQIGYMIPQVVFGDTTYGLEIIVRDDDSYHPALSPVHQYYWAINPTLLLQDSLLQTFTTQYGRLYDLAAQKQEISFHVQGWDRGTGHV
ncbi:MAG: hypothetical protein GF401_04945 [Chitinivibrionales bacterium]|nr:hypothetical protein [Chitinivibrionales bacterium]